MRILVNIEGAYGLPKPDQYIEHVLELFNIDMNEENVILVTKYQCSWFWLINGLTQEDYEDRIDGVSKYLNNLLNKGYLTYFYVACVNEDFSVDT